LLHRLGLEYHKPNVIPAKLDEDKQKAFIGNYEKLLNSLMGVMLFGHSRCWHALGAAMTPARFPAALPQRHCPLVILDPVSRGTGSNRIGDEARCQMPVMFLDHPRIGVSKVLRHHHERRAIHHCVRSPRVAEDVEADRRLDPGALTGFSHWPRLLRPLPRAAIAVAEHQFMPTTARTMISEECRALVRQHHMARLAALALPDRQRIGIGIEVAHFQLCKLAVAAAGFQPSAHQRAKFWIARVDQSLRLRDR
jgi:hypothetical protein